MAVWLVVKKWLSSHLFKLSNRNLLVISILYISLSWGFLALAGEKSANGQLLQLHLLPHGHR